jgi:hypothetical protein
MYPDEHPTAGGTRPWFSFGLIDRKEAALALLNVVSILLVYAPFLDRLSLITRYWDGPMYMYVAATLYSIPADSPLHVLNLPDYYYACHLALFPLMIRLFSFALGYEWAMLFVVAACSSLATVYFYRLLKEFNLSVNPFMVSAFFVFFPSRWLLYHSVGATEPLFVLLVIASLYYYKRESYLAAFVLAGLASVTRIFGILMLVSYVITLVYQKKYRHIPLTFIIPLFLGLNFAVYWAVYHDPLAYFRYNGGFMEAVPFLMFFENAARGATNNAELFFAFYVLFLLGTLRLRRHQEIFVFTAVYVLACAFVMHPDVSRYLLPAAPFALLVAFDEVIARKEFLLVFPLVVVFGYCYCWGILPTNLMGTDLYDRMMQAIGR